ncbi:MAG: inorganic diphosphatase [Chitinophagales bacterium]|nr:inorganic diphosphatase [Chitinophagales bacterium]
MKLPDTFADQTNNVNVIIETPKGSRNKYTYHPESGLFQLGKILPAGLVFPLDFGFIPETKAEDGDPVDVLVIMEVPGFAGCFVECRIIGVIEAEQTERNHKKVKNDRLLAIPVDSNQFAKIKTIDDLDKTFLNEIIEFFVQYNEMGGKNFKLQNISGPDVALTLVKKQMT